MTSIAERTTKTQERRAAPITGGSNEARYNSAINALRRKLIRLPTNRQTAFNTGVLCGMSKIKEVWGRDMEDLPADGAPHVKTRPRSASEKYQYAVGSLRRKVENARCSGRWREAYREGVMCAIAQIEKTWGPDPDGQAEPDPDADFWRAVL